MRRVVPDRIATKVSIPTPTIGNNSVAVSAGRRVYTRLPPRRYRSAARNGHPLPGQMATIRNVLAENSNDGGFMKIRFFGLLALLMVMALPASAADLVGRWTAEFESPIGVQKYVYEFKKAGEALTGQATFEHSMGQGTVDLESVKLEGDKVSFVEPLSIDGNEITITYNGTLAGDELKLTRNVGEFGSEELTAKRAK
jgi:hypothetical protein